MKMGPKYVITYDTIFKLWGFRSSVAAIVPKVSGLTSIIGSCHVVQDILKKPEKRRRSAFPRIILGLATFDMLSSFCVHFVSTWPMLKGHLMSVAGSKYTYDAIDFIFVLTVFSIRLYNCSLATYFLMQIKLDWSGDKRIKIIEKWFRIISWAVGLIVAFLEQSHKYGPNAFCVWASSEECTINSFE